MSAPAPNTRRRVRSDGTERLWWEPPAAARALGFAAVDLDVTKLQWSAREAARLNREAEAAVKRGRRDLPTAAGGRTIDALIDEFQRSTSWRDLAPKTQRDYAQKLGTIRTKWGRERVTDFSKPVMWQWYQTLNQHSGAWMAVALIRMMSIIFAHAERIGWRPENSNPCTRLKVKVPQGRKRTGSWAELDALIAAADACGLASIAVAVALSCFAGQRQTDILQAQAADFAPLPLPGGKPVWIWSLTRSKRGNDGLVKIHAEAAPRLAAAVAGAPPAGPMLRDERTGLAYSEDSFQRRWKEVRAAAVAGGMASLADMQFRDLRRTFGNLSRSAGASVDDVGDVLGNTAARNAQLRNVYMAPQLDTISRAVDAIRRPAKPKRRKTG